MSDVPHAQRVAILGLGLLGCSLGLALRTRRLAATVVGYDSDTAALDDARQRGAVDATSTTLAEAVAGADVVVLATPVRAMPHLLRDLAPLLGPRAIVTDLGSAKVEVVAAAERVLPTPARFLGGHPMAGSEQSGPGAGRADLFAGCTWCLTPTPTTDPHVVEHVTALVTALGARPHLLDAAQHDAAVASVSHLPRVAALALFLTAQQAPDWAEASLLAATGFREMTRLASGEARMAADLCRANAEHLGHSLDAYIARLHALRQMLATDSDAIEHEFQAGSTGRAAWLAQRLADA